VRSASFSVTGSPLQALLFDRQTAQRSARLFFLGQCAASLLLLLVLTAGALAVVASVSTLVSTKNLIGYANLDTRQSVDIQNSSDEKQRPPQQ
jgi:hypothetical protein